MNYFRVLILGLGLFWVTCSASLAQAIKKVNLEFTFTIQSLPNTQKVKLVCLIPQDIERVQKIQSISYSISPNRLFKDGGNQYAEFILQAPPPIKKIYVRTEMELYTYDWESRRTTKPLSSTKLAPFLKAERYLEVSHPSIQRQALRLQGKNSSETLKNIYEFVTHTLDYSGYVSEDVGAQKALQKKEGDCTEFADTFIALCRASGIPARFCEGYTLDYSNTPKHDWAQAYLPDYGWISFDPTPGNRARFEKMKNRYVLLSHRRNDASLNHYHYLAYWYWGSQIKVKSDFHVKEIKEE